MRMWTYTEELFALYAHGSNGGGHNGLDDLLLLWLSSSFERLFFLYNKHNDITRLSSLHFDANEVNGGEATACIKIS